MEVPARVERARVVERLRRRLELGWPRLLVAAMVALTAIAAFLVSAGLLRLGVGSMGLRYPLAVGAGYGVLLLQLRLWLGAQRRPVARAGLRPRRDGHLDPLDVADVAADLIDGRSAPAPRGGSFHGGGASGTFGPPVSSSGGGAGGDLDFDPEGWAVGLAAAVAAVALGAGVIATGFVIWAAPALLAEVLFDFLVSAALYRRLRHVSRAWWESALRRTWLPALVVVLFVGTAGLAFDRVFPAADSIGGVVRAVLAPQARGAPPTRASARVVLETARGEVELELDSTRAPVTAANFLRYVDAGRYSGGRFHRTVRADNQPVDRVRIAVVQAGVAPQREGEDFPPIALERTGATGLRHRDGTISMARAGPDTATSDFFVCLGDQPELDEGGRRNPDGQGFAAFGRVVRGMDVVRRIHAAPAEGQALTPPIEIRGARVVR